MLATKKTELVTLAKKGFDKFKIARIAGGGAIFIGLTVGIFWYQFTELPRDNPPEIWNQLEWGYFFWLLLVLPIETLAAGMRIWLIGRVLHPGIGFWTSIKAEWANIGLAMLTPSQTGGGLGQIYMLNRGGMNIGIALSVSLISFLGSMVILLFIGIFSLVACRIDHLAVAIHAALLISFIVFCAMIIAVCWPGSLHSIILKFFHVMGMTGRKNGKNNLIRHDPRGRTHLFIHLQRQLHKLINLCYHHQTNLHRFFRQNTVTFIWVCILSLIFMLARSIMAFLCMRFLGIGADSFSSVLIIQLRLIFMLYFAPTPGSSGLAEGASMLLMQGAVPAGFLPYYNLLWRSLTLFLPAMVGLLFLSWTMMQDARKLARRRC